MLWVIVGYYGGTYRNNGHVYDGWMGTIGVCGIQNEKRVVQVPLIVFYDGIGGAGEEG